MDREGMKSVLDLSLNSKLYAVLIDNLELVEIDGNKILQVESREAGIYVSCKLDNITIILLFDRSICGKIYSNVGFCNVYNVNAFLTRESAVSYIKKVAESRIKESNRILREL